jgi:signal transduction histidine kinase
MRNLMAESLSFRARVAQGLIGYALLLACLVGLLGYVLFEAVEREVWGSLLEAELGRIVAYREQDPGFEFVATDTLRLHVQPPDAALDAGLEWLAKLGPGLHDDVLWGERELAVLVRDHAGDRLYLVFDITELERRERLLALSVAVLALVAAGGLAVLGWLLAGNFMRPLNRLAVAVARLDPERGQERLPTLPASGPEVDLIAAAINRYIERQARFVQREREFVDSAGHELRTPIAVIAGAAELALSRPDLPAPARGQLQRILQTARGAEQLAAMLLLLAKDPARLVEASEEIRLEELLCELVEDHRHLAEGKALELHVGGLRASRLAAPLGVVQVAIGNLLRNAIEHSGHGTVEVGIDPPGVVWIEDPGQGMSPQEIARLYAAAARGGEGTTGTGIGLELIRRIAEHLGWRIEFSQSGSRGTRATLDLRASLVGND